MKIRRRRVQRRPRRVRTSRVQRRVPRSRARRPRRVVRVPASPARPTQMATCPWRRMRISWSTSRTSGRSRTLRLMAGLWAANRALKGDWFCAVGDASFESRVRGRARPGAWPRGRPESASSPGDPCAVGCWGRLAQIIARWVERSRAPRRRGGLPATDGSSCRVERVDEKEVGAGWFWPGWSGCAAALGWLPGWWFLFSALLCAVALCVQRRKFSPLLKATKTKKASPACSRRWPGSSTPRSTWWSRC